MLYIRGEGQTIRNGFNFYPLKEWAYSRGFVFKFGKLIKFFRYSVKLGRFV